MDIFFGAVIIANGAMMGLTTQLGPCFFSFLGGARQLWLSSGQVCCFVWGGARGGQMGNH